MTSKALDLTNPPKGITYKDATKTKPPGYRARVNLYDQWGDRRTLSEIIRAEDDSEQALHEALQKAIEWREHIEEKKTDIRWLQRQFDKPKEQQTMTVEELFAHSEKYGGGPENPTLQDFVERGMTRREPDGKLIEDPRSSEMGFLRRIHTDTSKNNFTMHCGIWSVIIQWGGIHSKTVEEITGADVDDFVRYLEQQTDDDGEHRYATSTIKNYRSRLRSMIRRFAIDQQVVNPLDITPSLRNPRQIRGRDKKRKCPTEQEMAILDNGFSIYVNQSPARYKPIRSVCQVIYQVLRYTGMRPSEAFALRPSVIDTISGKIRVEGAITEDGEGATKSQRLGAEDGTRVVPVASHVIERITEWIAQREDLGFPTIQEQPLIFCQPDGSHLTADILRDHFKKACQKGCKALSDDLDVEGYVTPYQLRHWRNDQLRKRGVPVELRSAVIGHDKEINPRYTDVETDELIEYLEDE